MPATKVPQTYALDHAAPGIGDFEVTSLKLTVLEGKFDSEMNIVME